MPGLTSAQSFGARFFALLVGAAVLAWAVELPNRLGAVQAALAQSAAWLASAAGSSNRILNDTIFVEGLTIHINYECTGAYVLIILLTFLVAYPAGWRQRLAGAAVGVPLLTVVNVVRIAVLIRVAELRPDLFAHFHEYVWQGVFLVLVIVYAMKWVEYVK